MSAPQPSDPAISPEWFPALGDSGRPDGVARRRHFGRLVTYTMVGLSAFAVLGLGCFLWRRHALQAALEAPPPAPLPPPVVAAAPRSAGVVEAPAVTPVLDVPVPPPPSAAAPPAPAIVRHAAARAKPKPAPVKKLAPRAAAALQTQRKPR